MTTLRTALSRSTVGIRFATEPYLAQAAPDTSQSLFNSTSSVSTTSKAVGARVSRWFVSHARPFSHFIKCRGGSGLGIPLQDCKEQGHSAGSRACMLRRTPPFTRDYHLHLSRSSLFDDPEAPYHPYYNWHHLNLVR